MIRLDKFLSQMNIGTRSEVKNAIRKGRVTVNGEVCKNADAKFDENKDIVCFDNKEVTYEEFVYYMLNKPAGVLSATTDKKEKTVVDLIDSDRKDLFPVGRLDKDTEGLLLITDDGKLAHELLSPKKHVWKTYMAHIEGKLPQNAIELFEEGIRIDEEFTAMPARLQIVYEADGLSERKTEVLISIQEGKFHQVKRMVKEIGCEVVYLKRLQMGNLKLDKNLKPGEYKKLSKAEIEDLKK